MMNVGVGDLGAQRSVAGTKRLAFRSMKNNNDEMRDVIDLVAHQFAQRVTPHRIGIPL